MDDQNKHAFNLGGAGLMTAQALCLPNGTVIVTKSNKRFTIIDTLQISFCRAVYVATLPNSEAKYVIKTEPPHSTGAGIRMEKAVAAVLQCATPMEAERFSEFVDYGESRMINFIIWKRLGPSLDELHQMYRQKFSLATSTRINVQTLRAISKLHALGFIHRNIQPSHFVVGESAKRVVYLISFSLARPFKLSTDGMDANRLSSKSSQRSKKKSSRASRSSKHDNAVTKDESSSAFSIARESSPTQQYFASRFWYFSDAGSTLSRLDDIESWFYLSLHFIDPECLPWSKSPLQMLSDIFNAKQDLFLHVYSDQMFGKDKAIPLDYRRFIDEINASSPNSTPDYEKLISIATKISHQACPNSNSPYDWEEIPATLASEYGSFHVPAYSPAFNSNAGMYSTRPKTKILGTDDPEMDRLVENWQNTFRKLILAGVPRAVAYRRVMGISHPPELANGHWKPLKSKKKKNKSKTIERSVDQTADDANGAQGSPKP